MGGPDRATVWVEELAVKQVHQVGLLHAAAHVALEREVDDLRGQELSSVLP